MDTIAQRHDYMQQLRPDKEEHQKKSLLHTAQIESETGVGSGYIRWTDYWKNDKRLYTFDSAAHCLFGKDNMTGEILPKKNLHVYVARFGKNVYAQKFKVLAAFKPSKFDGNHKGGYDVGVALCEQEENNYFDEKWREIYPKGAGGIDA